jgi:hypothetical protein
VDPRLVVDADVVADVVADVATGAIGPLISNSSSKATRFADVEVVDGTGLARCFNDDDVDAA